MYSLETPESVTVGYKISGVGTRFLAALIDTVILATVLIALLVVTFALGGTLTGTAGFVAVAIGLLIINVVLLGYYIFFELIWNGQSPGKRAMRLRVIQTSGYPVAPVAVLIRNVLRLVDWLPSFYAIGVVVMIANRQSRRLGDIVAGTMVIKEGREGALSSLPAAPPASPNLPPQAPPSWSAGAVSSDPYGPPAPWTGQAPAVGMPGPPGPAPYGASPPDYVPPAVPPPSGPAYARPQAPPYQPGGVSRNDGAVPRYGVPPDTQVLIAGGAEMARLTREDETLVRDFLYRRSTLPLQRRDALAHQIAAVIHGRIGGQVPPDLDPTLAPEAYLELVLAAREAR